MDKIEKKLREINPSDEVGKGYVDIGKMIVDAFSKSMSSLVLMAEEDYMRGRMSKKVHTAINETYTLYITTKKINT